ncbi:hypothetical protein AB1N83_012803 [Pleurotus pulmonarius]
MSNMTEPITKTLAPFDDDAADTTLRSSDGALFHVFRGILIFHSPFFRSLFSLPAYPDSNNHKDGRPIVDMQEDYPTLDLLLRFCYPMAPPTISSKETFCDVMFAAQKFEMSDLYDKIVDSHVGDRLLRTLPLEYYDLAHRFRLDLLGRKSAKGTLYHHLESILDQARGITFTHMSANSYNRLLHYHTSCRDACRKLVDSSDFSWLPNSGTYMFLSCRSCKPAGLVPVKITPKGAPAVATLSVPNRQWWFNHVKRIREDFSVCGPSAVATNHYKQALQDVAASGCTACRNAAIDDLQNFSAALDNQIESEISKIKLNIDF